jgi:NAD(P)-dependent dehydrogenase (short-subunit alcohol dehydrogenase family)
MTPHGSPGVKKRRRALVTGGAARLGRTVALALADAGMDVAIGYHRSAREARRTLRELEAHGARGVAIAADLTDARAARRLVERAAAALRGLDVLVNGAAVFVRTPLATTTPAQYDALLDLNLRGAFFCAQAAAALMGASGGHIVNIGDAGATGAWPGYIPYTVSKAGITALTRALAVALRERRIAVNCVAPGAVLRPRAFSRARWERVTRGRSVDPTDVATAVVFFATCPPDVTGQVLDVDGTGALRRRRHS